MQQYEPLYADRHRSAFRFSLVMSLVVAVVGLLFKAPLLVILGLAVAAFSWFTTPAQYMIFDDRLAIAYGRPRVRHIFFQQIDQVEVLRLAIGDRLRVRLRHGRPLFIQPNDLDQFHSRLDGALASYRRDHPEGLQGPEI